MVDNPSNPVFWNPNQYHLSLLTTFVKLGVCYSSTLMTSRTLTGCRRVGLSCGPKVSLRGWGEVVSSGYFQRKVVLCKLWWWVAWGYGACGRGFDTPLLRWRLCPVGCVQLRVVSVPVLGVWVHLIPLNTMRCPSTKRGGWVLGTS